MHFMCFNISICFKMGSLYSYCGIITKLVYPPELSRIAGFCTNSNKTFLGEDPSFKENYLRLYYNHHTAIHLKKLKTHTQISPPPTIFLANSRSNGLCMSYLKSPLLIIFSRIDVWKNKEKSLKTPWICTSKVLEKGMSWSVGTMVSVCLAISLSVNLSVNLSICLSICLYHFRYYRALQLQVVSSRLKNTGRKICAIYSLI